ncbi:MAG: hypothetical protein NTX25_11285 [Proteobacteria bacterium]|nr:hypothetical protein [Pseudomonadota bacterium]
MQAKIPYALRWNEFGASQAWRVSTLSLQQHIKRSSQQNSTKDEGAARGF